jgi:hypothetical protein
MPRGGRRPGAGAPKGNFNAVRSGNRSKRMLMVYMALKQHDDLLAVGRELYEHGLIHPPRGPRKEVFNGDVRPIVNYLYHRCFDRSDDGQSPTIEEQWSAARVAPAAEAETAPAPLEIPGEEKNARNQWTIKERHLAALLDAESEDEVQ